MPCGDKGTGSYGYYNHSSLFSSIFYETKGKQSQNKRRELGTASDTPRPAQDEH